MKRMRKLIGLMFVMGMIFSLSPTKGLWEVAAAESDVASTDIDYKIVYSITENDEIEIWGIDVSDEFVMDSDAECDVTIPSEIDGRPVTTISSMKGNQWMQLYTIRLLTIPASVTAIGDGALNEGGDVLKIVVAQDNPVYCTDEAGLLYNKDMTELIAVPNIEEVFVNDSVKRMRPKAFDNSVTKVNLPKSLEWAEVEDDVMWDDRQGMAEVFRWCYDLKEFAISDENQAYAVKDGILYDKSCETLVLCPVGKKGSVILPDGVKRIKAYAFDNAWVTVTLPNSLTTIDNNAFNGIDNTTIQIPASVTSIAPLAFRWCNALTIITVDSDNKNYCAVDNILYTKDKSTLVFCPRGFQGVALIQDGVKKIEGYAMYACEGVTEVKLPDGVLVINDGAFSGCTNLKKINIPESVTKINVAPLSEGPFNLENLEQIDVVEKSYAHDWLLANDCDAGKIHFVPKKEISAPAVGTEIKDTDQTASYKVTNGGSVKDGVVTGAEVTYEAPSDRMGTIAIPATITDDNGIVYKVTSIDAKAFQKDTKLTKITIGDNIKTIPANAFNGCTKLKTVQIGKNVTTIGDKAFYKCGALTKITIPKKVKKIGKQAFYNCKKLKTITIQTEKLSSVGSKAITGIKKDATIKVPKKKLSQYKKLFNSKTGFKKTMKVKKA